MKTKKLNSMCTYYRDTKKERDTLNNLYLLVYRSVSVLLVIPVVLHDGCLALFPVPGLLLCRGCKLGRGLETDVLYNVCSCMAVLAFSGGCTLLHS